MKRTRGILGFVMAACLLGGLAGCGGQAASASAAPARPASSSPASSAAADAASSEAAAASSVPAPEDGVLVAYFSATGNTRAVAEKIAALTGGDLYEIVPAQPYTSEDLDWRNSQSRSSQEMDDPDARPEIAGSPVEMDGYGTLYLGYPIWHGQAPPHPQHLCGELRPGRDAGDPLLHVGQQRHRLQCRQPGGTGGRRRLAGRPAVRQRRAGQRAAGLDRRPGVRG